MKWIVLVMFSAVVAFLAFSQVQGQDGGYRISFPLAARAELTPTPVPTPLPVREWDLEGVQVEGSSVTVLLRVYAGIDVRVTMDGREPDRLESPLPLLRFIFENVAPGKHTVQVRDVVGHQESVEVVLP